MLKQSSPNFDDRKGCDAPSLVILHYTGMIDGASAIARLCDAASKVSAHYVVEEDGRVFQLVDEAKRAWHAGKSFWRGIVDVNSHSIGIEIVNPGHEFGYRPFPGEQMQAVLKLCLEIKARYTLPATAFIGHSDVAPLRKEDPGELFDWKMLAQNGIGIWPEPLAQDDEPLTLVGAEKLLSGIGYDCGIDEESLHAALRAFQRHFVQHRVTGQLDSDTAKTLRAVSRVF
ncbi:MAG: N-acetylmuramoyl-L-alanine amidase [Alphaproteobacteria bacterium]|nr:N-acetylmuramoyl-L-alanine amidase [Alphaproteobacteria bacterium]